MEYNKAHGITPKSVQRAIPEGLQSTASCDQVEDDTISVEEDSEMQATKTVIADLEADMLEAAQQLNFEKAALLRDQIESLKKLSPINQEGRSSSKKVVNERAVGRTTRKSRAVYNKAGLPKRGRKSSKR
tara:strand:- start:301 stop:690 length:390 start_codon:yes stop_codon:yes gene_type:complete